MQKEIETRFLDINKDELAKKLVLLGALDEGEEKLEEIIFHAADMSWVGKRKFVRLRKTKGKTCFPVVLPRGPCRKVRKPRFSSILTS
jgi:adenylate cyclase class IV